LLNFELSNKGFLLIIDEIGRNQLVAGATAPARSPSGSSSGCSESRMMAMVDSKNKRRRSTLPFLLLLKQMATHKALDRCLVWEDANRVGAAFDLLVQALQWIGAPDCASSPGEAQEGQHAIHGSGDLLLVGSNLRVIDLPIHCNASQSQLPEVRSPPRLSRGGRPGRLNPLQGPPSRSLLSWMSTTL